MEIVCRGLQARDGEIFFLGLIQIDVTFEYIRAAQAAIKGLEEEADEILAQCKYVANFDWDNRAKLYSRMDLYINGDRLRPILIESINGIKSCKDYAEKNILIFWGNKKRDAIKRLTELIDELTGNLTSLSAILNYDKSNYFGPSGINLPELLEIQELLLDKPSIILGENEFSDKNSQKMKVLSLSEKTQKERNKRGLMITSNINTVVQNLIVGFQLAE